MPLLRTNPELLAAFRTGERDALETVYREYARTLHFYFRSLMRSSGCVERVQLTLIPDLLQDAFLRAFSTTSRQAYDEARDFLPYLKTIARNCWIDAMRRRNSERPMYEALAHEAREIHWKDSADASESSDPEVLAALAAYLSTLPSPLREVYEQRFVHGRSQVISSAALGLSRRTLRTQEEHLRRGLRQALRRAGLLEPAPN